MASRVLCKRPVSHACLLGREGTTTARAVARTGLEKAKADSPGNRPGARREGARRLQLPEQ